MTTYRIRNIAIAGALALLAALLTAWYVTSYKRDVQRAEDEVTVYVASRDIGAGTPGTELESAFEKAELSRRTVVQGAISDPEEVRDLFVTQKILSGEQVSIRRFGPAAARGIRGELTSNQRAIQVAGDRNQLLVGTLRAGDRVDVLASVKYKVSDVVAAEFAGTTDVERVASRIVLRNLRVLKTAPATGTSGRLANPVSSDWVILAVTDSQSQKLFFVLKNGDWSLQLRPPLRATDSPSSIETIESVLGDGLRPRQLRQLYPGGETR